MKQTPYSNDDYKISVTANETHSEKTYFYVVTINAHDWVQIHKKSDETIFFVVVLCNDNNVIIFCSYSGLLSILRSLFHSLPKQMLVAGVMSSTACLAWAKIFTTVGACVTTAFIQSGINKNLKLLVVTSKNSFNGTTCGGTVYIRYRYINNRPM